MQKKYKFQALIWFGLFFLPAVTFAQLDLGLQIGRNFAEGDAHCFEDQDINLFSPTGASYGAFLRYKFWEKRMGARLHYAYLPLKFDETQFSNAAHSNRNFNGRNNASDLSLELTYHFLRNKKLRPYILGGLGLQFANYDLSFGSLAQNPNFQERIRQDRDAGTRNFILPVGAGLEWQLSERFGLHLESSMRLPVSDYYDGISQAANPNENDWYGYGMVGLTYRLQDFPDEDKDGIVDKKDACPTVAGLKAFQGCPDSDADGIKDSEDRCPQIFGLATGKGCPDGDEDGTVDIDDLCPEVKGLVDMKGCPDSDGDMLSDLVDECPDVKGSSVHKGCPDTDGDGVRDKDDACPEVAGVLTLNGCPDSDGDGIADKSDACPEQAGLRTYDGCPMPDADNDGVADDKDKCPSVAGVAANDGCPEVGSRGGVVDFSNPRNVIIDGVYYDENGVATGAAVGSSRQACSACNGTSDDPIFNPNCSNPRKLSRLGTNPEFGNSHALSPTEFYEKLVKAYKNNEIDREFLDRIYRGIGYSSFAEATASQFSNVILPKGTSGMLGYAKTHGTGCYTLPDGEYHRKAFRIEGANGCVMHFMKTCGNHFFFCD